MHSLACVWTDTLVDVVDEETVFEPPLVLDDDSLVTSPFTATLPVESPTTIFDPPKPKKRLASGSGHIPLRNLEQQIAPQRNENARRVDERHLNERLERMDASMRRLEQQELDNSYEAAMRQFR